MLSKSSPPPADKILSDKSLKVWLRFVYLIYTTLDYCPLTPREIRENFYKEISLIPIPSIPYYNSLFTTTSRWGMIYRFGDVAWKGYSYMISIRGLNKLHKKGLISDEELSYSKELVLAKLKSIDEKRYNKVISAKKSH